MLIAYSGIIVIAAPIVLISLGYLILRRRNNWGVSSLVLSLAMASGPLLFFLIRQLGSWHGGADIGFGIILLFSPILSVPLAIGGLVWGRRLKIKWAVFIGLGFVIFFSSLAFLYNHSIAQQEKRFKEKSKLNCNILPFHCAVRDGRDRDFESLIAQGYDINATNAWGNSPLHQAGSKIVTSRSLLTLGADPNLLSGYGPTLIAMAVVETAEPNFEWAKLLLQHGADINLMYASGNDVKKMPPINAAISKKNSAATRFLIEHGANVHLKDDYGHTACGRMELYKLNEVSELKKLCNP